MESNMIEKFFDMLKRDVLGISLTKKEEDIDFYIYFKCDFKKDLVSYVIVRKNDEFRTENKGIVTNEEELYNLIYSYNLEDSAEKMVNFRLSKERKYRDVRKYLLNKIEKMDLNVHQRAILTSIILKTTELSEYVGKGNVVVINKGDATASDVRRLIEAVSEKVFLETSVKLEPEVEFIGR